MTRIAEAFSNKKAFIPFLTCGDPDLETTAEFIKVIVAAQNFCQNFSKLLTKLFGKYFRYL